MLKLSKVLQAGAFVAAFGFVGGAAFAEEVPEGTVLNASNITKLMKSGTFNGVPIKDMLTERMPDMIKTYSMTYPLGKPLEMRFDKGWVAETARNKDVLKYDASAKDVYGKDCNCVEEWKGGMPFSDIKMDDPNGGEKFIWNIYLGEPSGNITYYNKFAFIWMNNKGVERIQHWQWLRWYSSGRFDGLAIPRGNIRYKTIINSRFPKDVKGTGVYFVRYDQNGKYDDTYAYIRSARRVRRLSGGAWMDPIGGSDWLNSDAENINVHPSWYKSYKLLKRQQIIQVIHSNALGSWKLNQSGTRFEHFPYFALANTPPWDFSTGMPGMDLYAPYESYVVEAISYEDHPYSRMKWYAPVAFPRAQFVEAYDRKGEWWKFSDYHLGNIPGEDGEYVMSSMVGHFCDVQNLHCTGFYMNEGIRFNPLGVKENDISVARLEKGGD